MGNNLSNPSGGTYGVINNVDTPGTKATLLELYINNFFKNYKDPINTDNLHPTKQGAYKALTTYPYRARSCCTESQLIPVALPFVDDVYPETGQKIPDDKKATDTVIKTAYPLVKIFSDAEWGNDGYKKDPGICRGFVDGNKYEYEITARENDFRNQKEDSTNPSCHRFYIGLETDIKDGGKTKEFGFCKRILDQRSNNYKYNKLQQFYGDVHKGGDIHLLDRLGLPARVKNTHNNAYPDCNCVNSIVEREYQDQPWYEPEKGEDHADNIENRSNAAQFQDGFCRSGLRPRYIRRINEKAINLCINVARDIKAVAAPGAEIKIEQSCQTDVAVKKHESKTLASKMDNEDNSKIKEKQKEEVKQTAKVEPAKVEPAKVEPAKVEPAKVEPAKVEPAKVEPAKVEPAKVEPAKVEPAKANDIKPTLAQGAKKKQPHYLIIFIIIIVVIGIAFIFILKKDKKNINELIENEIPYEI